MSTSVTPSPFLPSFPVPIPPTEQHHHHHQHLMTNKDGGPAHAPSETGDADSALSSSGCSSDNRNRKDSSDSSSAIYEDLSAPQAALELSDCGAADRILPTDGSRWSRTYQAEMSCGSPPYLPKENFEAYDLANDVTFASDVTITTENLMTSPLGGGEEPTTTTAVRPIDNVGSAAPFTLTSQTLHELSTRLGFLGCGFSKSSPPPVMHLAPTTITPIVSDNDADAVGILGPRCGLLTNHTLGGAAKADVCLVCKTCPDRSNTCIGATEGGGSLKTLSCFHHCCTVCLEKLAMESTASNMISCPLCQQVTYLPAKGGVSGLMSKASWNGLLSVGHNVGPSSSLPLPSIIPPINDCLPSLSNTSATTSTINPKAGSGMTCNKHKGELLRYFCKTCVLMICQDCTLVDHGAPTHDYVYVDEQAQHHPKEFSPDTVLNPKFNAKLKGLVEMIRAKLFEYELNLKNADKAAQKLQVQYTQAKRDINDASINFHNAVDLRKAETLRDLEAAFTTKQVKISYFSQNLRDFLQKSSQSVQILDKFANISGPNPKSDIDVHMIKNLIESRIACIFNFSPDALSKQSINGDLEFVPPTGPINAMVKNFFGQIRGSPNYTTTTNNNDTNQYIINTNNGNVNSNTYSQNCNFRPNLEDKSVLGNVRQSTFLNYEDDADDAQNVKSYKPLGASCLMKGFNEASHHARTQHDNYEKWSNGMMSINDNAGLGMMGSMSTYINKNAMELGNFGLLGGTADGGRPIEINGSAGYGTKKDDAANAAGPSLTSYLGGGMAALTNFGTGGMVGPDKMSNGYTAADDLYWANSGIVGQQTGGSSALPMHSKANHIKRRKMIYHCKFGEFGLLEGQFTEPSGVAVNAQGDIIVADTNNHRIQIFDREGRFKFQFGECGKRDGQLLYPNRVAAVRSSGDIVVTERSPTHQIQIFNQYGQFLRKFGADVLQHPRGVAVDPEGRVIIVECKVMRVVIFDHISGEVLHKFGCSKHLEFPNGLAVNDRSEIFISDNRAHCVKVFDYNGNFLRQVGGPGITNYPIGVGIEPNTGRLLVADNHNNFNLTVFDQQGNLLDALESKVKHAQCFDVALLDDDSVVLASKDFRIYVYRYNNSNNSSGSGSNNGLGFGSARSSISGSPPHQLHLMNGGSLNVGPTPTTHNNPNANNLNHYLGNSNGANVYGNKYGKIGNAPSPYNVSNAHPNLTAPFDALPQIGSHIGLNDNGPVPLGVTWRQSLLQALEPYITEEVMIGGGNAHQNGPPYLGNVPSDTLLGRCSDGADRSKFFVNQQQQQHQFAPPSSSTGSSYSLQQSYHQQHQQQFFSDASSGPKSTGVYKSGLTNNFPTSDTNFADLQAMYKAPEESFCSFEEYGGKEKKMAGGCFNGSDRPNPNFDGYGGAYFNGGAGGINGLHPADEFNQFWAPAYNHIKSDNSSSSNLGIIGNGNFLGMGEKAKLSYKMLPNGN